MGIYVVAVGLVVRDGQRTWRFERALDDEKKTVVFLDELTHAPRTMSLAELHRLVDSGRLTVDRGDSPSLLRTTGRPAGLISTVEDLRPEVRAEIERRHRYLLYLKKLGITRGQRKRITQAIDRLAGKLPLQAAGKGALDPRPPSASAVMDWMRRSELSGGSLSALIHRSSIRTSGPRANPRVREVALDLIGDHYLRRKRPVLTQTKLLIDRKLSALAQSGEVPHDEARISMSTVKRMVLAVPPFERDVARFGPAYAKNKWRYSLAGLRVTRPLERYEIDHTILDVVVIDDTSGMPLGRPTITLIVDSFSGYVAGFFISFWGAGLASALAALKVAIAPKDDVTADQGLSRPWLPYGIPMLIVADNGLEFHSPQFHAVAMHLGTDLEFCPTRQPWFKPVVERTFGTLNLYLPASGRVEKPRNNYLPLRADKTAAITFGALCRGILKAVVEILPLERNARTLCRPFDKFSEGMEGLLPPSLPTSTEELNLIVAQSGSATVNHEGVVKNHLRYNSDGLRDLRRATGSNFSTAIKFDPNDIGKMYVKDPVSGAWLCVPSCRPEYTTGLSIVQHKAIRARVKGDLNQRNADEMLIRSKLELIDEWNTQHIRGRRLKPTQLRGLAQLTSGHVLGPKPERGLAGGDPQPRLVTESELRPMPTDIPTFEPIALRRRDAR